MRPERQHRPRSTPEPSAQHERAVRWLRRSHRAGAIVDRRSARRDARRTSPGRPTVGASAHARHRGAACGQPAPACRRRDQALSQFRRPILQIHRLGSVAGQVRQLLREGRAPGVSLNRPVGKHRRLLFVRAALSEAKEVAHAHGAKVNDVALAAIAGGAR
jgi:hypothetical protein